MINVPRARGFLLELRSRAVHHAVMAGREAGDCPFPAGQSDTIREALRAWECASGVAGLVAGALAAEAESWPDGAWRATLHDAVEGTAAAAGCLAAARAHRAYALGEGRARPVAYAADAAIADERALLFAAVADLEGGL